MPSLRAPGLSWGVSIAGTGSDQRSSHEVASIISQIDWGDVDSVENRREQESDEVAVGMSVEGTIGNPQGTLMSAAVYMDMLNALSRDYGGQDAQRHQGNYYWGIL